MLTGFELYPRWVPLMNLHRVDDFENPEFKILLRHQDQKFKNL